MYIFRTELLIVQNLNQFQAPHFHGQGYLHVWSQNPPISFQSSLKVASVPRKEKIPNKRIKSKKNNYNVITVTNYLM